MILLWGVMTDDSISAVYCALRNLGYHEGNNSDKTLLFFDQQNDLLNSNMELFVNSKVEGKIEIGNGKKNNDAYKQIDLSNIASAYFRPYDWRYLPGIENTVQDSDQWQHASYVEDTMVLWSELSPALVINRPSATASNSSKPYQAIQISSLAGFDIPDTLITTDPKAVKEFWKYHGDVIYKSVSGVRSIVSRLKSEHLERINDVSWCPTQFQEYVHGNDYRVHVVGEEQMFACKIISKADDYRYATRYGLSTEIQSCSIPLDVQERCISLAKKMGLVLAGIDLRYNPNSNRWYCFEVNPSPAFFYYQDSTGQQIDKAIAQLLIREDTK
jgi:hypothetical protein